MRRTVHPAIGLKRKLVKKYHHRTGGLNSLGPIRVRPSIFGAQVADSPAASFAGLLRSRNFPCQIRSAPNGTAATQLAHYPPSNHIKVQPQ